MKLLALSRKWDQSGFFEMRLSKMTPAHHTGKLAELVCSNSFRSNEITNAAGLLKQEMRIMDSIIIQVADMTRVPAGAVSC